MLIKELLMMHEGEGNENRRGFNHGVKVEFTHFEGDNPTSWVFKATQYFEFHQTPLAY